MKRGELWLAEVGRKRRPVLLLTRSEVLDVRDLVTVAEITTSIRGLVAEVDIDYVEVGLDRPSVINCDGLHTVTQASLTGPVGRVGDDVLRKVCSAVSYALGKNVTIVAAAGNDGGDSIAYPAALDMRVRRMSVPVGGRSSRGGSARIEQQQNLTSCG